MQRPMNSEETKLRLLIQKARKRAIDDWILNGDFVQASD
jgi:hypothetical protein